MKHEITQSRIRQIINEEIQNLISETETSEKNNATQGPKTTAGKSFEKSQTSTAQNAAKKLDTAAKLSDAFVDIIKNSTQGQADQGKELKASALKTLLSNVYKQVTQRLLNK